MKTLKRFSAVVSAAALLAVAFTGCNNSFAGTELNYAEKESEKVGTTGDLQDLSSATISSSLTTGVGFTGKASTRTSFTVTVTNNATNGTNTRVNLASAKEAINFYAVTNGTATTNKVRSAVLPKTLFSESETENSATFKFEVDTSSIPTSDVAVFVDATKLKDKQGTLILNLDGNYKRGEATDNYINYITVDSSKTATTGVNENFCPAWTPIAGAPAVVRLVNASDFKLTGEYEVQVTPQAYSKDSATAAATVNKDLAATLNTVYALRTREPGATSTTTKALSFSWDETKGKYIASAGNLVPGTKYDIVITKKDVSSLAPTWYTSYYGHPAFIANDAFGSKTAAAAGTADVYVNTPDYIIEGYSATASTWNPTQKTAANIATAQSTFLSATLNGRVFSVTVRDSEKLEFESYKDFMVVDSNDGVEYKLPIEYRVKLNDADNPNPNRLVGLEIEITNKNITLSNNVKLYVGSGVVLKNNPTNPTQKKFGAFKDAADGIHSGYVALN